MSNCIIFSYSLFEPISLFEDQRRHDPHNNKSRYWYNLPLIPIINSILFPSSKSVFYVSENIWENPLSDLLLQIEQRFEEVTVITKKCNYQSIEPTFWRFEPIFDTGNEYVFPRDIDSITTLGELYCLGYFIENNESFIQTIRSHANHQFPITVMLAGLSGFKPNKIDFLRNQSYQDFYKSNTSINYGSDQKALIRFFTQNAEINRKHFLDCQINTVYQVSKPLISCKEFVYTNKLEKEIFKKNNSPIIKWIGEKKRWCGEPIDGRGQILESLLRLDYLECKKMLIALSKTNQFVRDFFLSSIPINQ